MTSYQPQSSNSTPLSPSEERTWAMLAHLSILLNLVSGILGPLAPLLIYLFLKDRSRYVAYQSLQALLFQLVFWIGGGTVAFLAWVLGIALTSGFIGICCFPFAALLSLIPVGAIVYGIIGGIQCSQGKDFRYWLVGDWVRGTLTG